MAIETSCDLSRARTGDFSSTDVDSVLHIMPDPARAVIHKGWFPDTFADVTDEDFLFRISGCGPLRSDCRCASTVYERLSTGGVLLIHDVYSTQFSGCKKAVDEFCQKNHLFADPVCDLHGSAILGKIEEILY